MKRCSECGFTRNKDNATHCEMCGAILKKPGGHNININSTNSPSKNLHTKNQSPLNPKKTVKGEPSNAQAWDMSKSDINSTSTNKNTPQSNNFKSFSPSMNNPTSLMCPNCNYALRTPVTLAPCPNCNYYQPNQDGNQQTPMSKKTMGFGQLSGIGNSGDTSSSYKLVDASNNQKILNSGQDLNRDNLSPGDMSISGGSHAIIRNNNGSWTIENRSGNGFTFVQVQGTMQIKNGDLIVIGNKIYKFETS